MGTVLESLHGTAVAQERVYGTWWFTLVLFLLGVNVLCAALSRLPWKRHHLGFVITHAGIITILIGAVITQKSGINGSISLAEGSETDRITLDDPRLQVFVPGQRFVKSWKARFSQDPPREDKPWAKTLEDGSQLRIDRYFSHSQISLNVTDEAASDNPALKVVLSGLPMGADQEIAQWLFLKESDLSSPSAEVGPARISFIDQAKLVGLPTKVPQSSAKKIGILKLRGRDGLSAEIPVEQATGEMPIPGSDYRLKLLRYLPDARVVNNQLVAGSEAAKNPALEFKILGKEGEETFVAFANFPDMDNMHADKHSKYGVKAVFLSEAAPSPFSQAELLFALDARQQILYRIRSQGILGSVKTAKVGEELPTGWMNIRFKVAEYVPRAQVNVAYRRVVVPEGKPGPPPAIHFKIEKSGKSAEGWMQQGDEKDIAVGGAPYTIRYGLRVKPLGFSLQLKKFELGRYVGTNKPSSFASEVEVKNKQAGENFAVKISMNEPLDYRGYKFYQSSYQEGNEGSPTISILSVGKDPGTPIKYAGSILLVSGIGLMFWLKPLFAQKRLVARRQEKMEMIGQKI